MKDTTPEQRERLKNLSEHRYELVEELAEIHIENIEESGLDPRTHSLCRLATLVAIDAPVASYAWQISVAEESGVTIDDFIGVLIALTPTIGFAKIVAAASKLAVLYDIEIDLDQAA